MNRIELSVMRAMVTVALKDVTFVVTTWDFDCGFVVSGCFQWVFVKFFYLSMKIQHNFFHIYHCHNMLLNP